MSHLEPTLHREMHQIPKSGRSVLEKDDCGVAREEQDVATVFVDQVGQSTVIVVQDLRERLGAARTSLRERLGDRCEPGHIDEQDCSLEALFVREGPDSVFEDLIELESGNVGDELRRRLA